jgi:hypothetical protein
MLFEQVTFAGRNTQKNAQKKEYQIGKVRMKIRRREGFYVRIFEAPAVTIAVLALLSFVIPLDAGERIGFSVTVTLTVVSTKPNRALDAGERIGFSVTVTLTVVSTQS